MNISTLTQARDALSLVQAGLLSNNTGIVPAALEVVNALTEYCHQLSDSAAHRREPSPDDYAVLYIDSPQSALSALYLVEAGLEYAQNMPSVLSATHEVAAAVMAYFNDLMTEVPAPATPAA